MTKKLTHTRLGSAGNHGRIDLQQTGQAEYCMTFLVELEQEEDGRWIAEVAELPGVLAYGETPQKARAKVQALALRVVAEQLEHGEISPELVNVSFAAA